MSTVRIVEIKSLVSTIKEECLGISDDIYKMQMQLKEQPDSLSNESELTIDEKSPFSHFQLKALDQDGKEKATSLKLKAIGGDDDDCDEGLDYDPECMDELAQENSGISLHDAEDDLKSSISLSYSVQHQPHLN